MRIELAYGRDGLVVDLPADRTTVVEPRFVPGLPDEAEALRGALRNPIAHAPLLEWLRPDDTVGISICDITRPMPSARVLPVLLAEVEKVVARDRITIFNGTGTHRANTEDEMRRMVGDHVFETYRIVTHDAREVGALVSVGRTASGNEVWLNAAFMACTAKILTGFIEPHFFAGFSGGPKMVMPALAGLDTIMRNHGHRNISDPRATWGITDGNPLWEELRDGALMAGRAFNLNVTLNKHHEITGVFAGDLLTSHRTGCAFVRETAMQAVARPFDVVVTTNSGYPLDLNVYQAIKGISAAARVCRDGGAIVAAAECWDGIPDHGEYRRLLEEGANPEAIVERVAAPGFRMADQWQAQVQAQIQQRCAVHLYSSLPAETVRRTHLSPCADIAATVTDLLAAAGPEATLCVLPQGPQTIPYLG